MLIPRGRFRERDCDSMGGDFNKKDCGQDTRGIWKDLAFQGLPVCSLSQDGETLLAVVKELGGR